MGVELDNIKVGDIVVHCNFGSRQAIKVERITKTQFITDSGWRFRRKNGYAVGGARDYIRPPGEGELKKLELQAKARVLGRIRWEDMPGRTIHQVYAMYMKIQEETRKKLK